MLPEIDSRKVREGLRLARTNFVHRWHAAQTVGELLGNDAVGERFEHINHAKSLAEYVWRYGAFVEASDGGGRVAREDVPSSLRDIVAPLAAEPGNSLRTAALYALGVARYGEDPADWPGGANSGAAPAANLLELQRYGESNLAIRRFATGVIELHRGMLDYYVQMALLTREEADACRTGAIPLFAPFTPAGGRPAKQLMSGGEVASGAEVVGALRRAFARNLYNALVARAQSELLETVVRHPRGHAIATEIVEGGPHPAPHQCVVAAIVQGRRRQFVIRDEALAAMLRSLDEPPMPPAVRWLTAFRTAVSAMITTMPVFIVKNFFRDTLSGFVAGRHWQIPIISTLAGSLHAVRDLRSGRSEVMREYLLQGGFFSALVESETQIDDERAPAAAGARARQRAARLVYLLTRPAWIAEAGTRVHQFQKALACGASPYAAARAARMVSADFANIGASRNWRMYVHTVPFMNAAIQGFDQLYQIVRPRARVRNDAPRWDGERKLHARKTLLAGLCLSAMTLAAWGYNTSDEARLAAYRSETEYEKASWLTLYNVAGNTDIRIPAPFQIGAMFMKVPEVAFDLASGADTLAGFRFVWALIHGNLAIGWIPAAAQPFVEVWTNRNFFGAEIIPAYMQSWLPEHQFFARSTLLPYRFVGRVLGVSPLHVQTFVRGWTGHLGNAVVIGMDELAWLAGRNGPKPFPRTAGLVTGLESLRPPPLRTYTRYSNEFYEISDWFNAYARTVPQRHPARRVRTYIDRHRRWAADVRNRGDRIRMAPNLSRRDKERQLIALYRSIDARFVANLPAMRDYYRQYR